LDGVCLQLREALAQAVQFTFNPHQLVVAVLQNLIAFLGFADQPLDLATERLLDVGTNADAFVKLGGVVG
jgi:hypothetical protein